MAFVGHVFRKGDICTDLLIGAVYEKRGKGRPKTRYSDNIGSFHLKTVQKFQFCNPPSQNLLIFGTH